jgi:peroxiredoxin
MMLQRGDPVPHFDVRTHDDRRVSYTAIWQHRNLLLISLPGEKCAACEAYIAQLSVQMAAFASHHSECVITRDRVPGIPSPSVVVADKWGEIAYVATASDIADLPPAQELVEWVGYLQNQCPECEGEAR